jgi:hypothetical protein
MLKKERMRYKYLIFIPLLFGCASMAGLKYGDDQAVKVQTDKLEQTAKVAETAEIQTPITGQIGYANETTNDMKQTSSGGDTIIGDNREALNKLVLNNMILIIALLIMWIIQIVTSFMNKRALIKALTTDPRTFIK